MRACSAPARLAAALLYLQCGSVMSAYNAAGDREQEMNACARHRRGICLYARGYAFWKNFAVQRYCALKSELGSVSIAMYIELESEKVYNDDCFFLLGMIGRSRGEFMRVLSWQCLNYPHQSWFIYWF